MAYTTAKDRLASLVDTQVTKLAEDGVVLTQAQVTDLKRITGEWLDSTQFKSIALANNKPDYNQILLQFQNALEHEDAWKDVLTSGAGQSILRMFSAVGELVTYAQERAVQERFSYTARLPSSIYASTRSYGVRIDRRTPARVNVQLSRQNSDYLIVNAFTAFVVGDTKFFNREPIVFSQGSIFPVVAELVQGEVFLDTYKSPGVPFASYEVGNGDASISDVDVYLYVDGVEYTRITYAFDSYGPNDTVFFDATLPNGNVEVITGSGNYGVMPTSAQNVQIRYAVTKGVEAHNANVELLVTCPDFPTISGYSMTPVEGGAIPNSPDFYKINAPFVRSSGNRAVLRRDYTLAAINYKPIAIRDARVIGQKEIAPNEKWAQGVIKICALTDQEMTDSQWDDFIAYIEKFGMEGMTILRENKVAVPIDLVVDVGATQDRELEAVKQAITAVINDAYAPKLGSLGNDFYRNDVQTIIKDSDNPVISGGINWLVINTPGLGEQHLQLAWNQYVVINSLVVNVAYSNREYSNRLGSV